MTTPYQKNPVPWVMKFTILVTLSLQSLVYTKSDLSAVEKKIFFSKKSINITLFIPKLSSPRVGLMEITISCLLIRLMVHTKHGPVVREIEEDVNLRRTTKGD